MENKRTGKSPAPISDETVDLSHNLPSQKLCAAVDSLHKVMDGGLFQEALAISNEQCKNLINQQNMLFKDLTQQVRSVEESNSVLVRSLQENNRSVTSRLEIAIDRQAALKTETVQEMQRTSAKVIEFGIERFAEKVDEATADVKTKLKETEKEISELKEQIHFERGFRKFLFWTTPLMLLAQTLLSIFLLLK